MPPRGGAGQQRRRAAAASSTQAALQGQARRARARDSTGGAGLAGRSLVGQSTPASLLLLLRTACAPLRGCCTLQAAMLSLRCAARAARRAAGAPCRTLHASGSAAADAPACGSGACATPSVCASSDASSSSRDIAFKPARSGWGYSRVRAAVCVCGASVPVTSRGATELHALTGACARLRSRVTWRVCQPPQKAAANWDNIFGKKKADAAADGAADAARGAASTQGSVGVADGAAAQRAAA
jgi:hypothetical protein